MSVPFLQSVVCRHASAMRDRARLGCFPIAAIVLVSFASATWPNAVTAALSDRPNPAYVTNGPVNALVRSGNTIYIGGQFDRIGVRSGPGVEVALDGTRVSGQPEVAGNGPSGFVGFGGGLNAVEADGSGGWYIGGLFTHVGDVPRTNLAHILADHSVDPAFNPDVNDAVHALLVSGPNVYVGGLFTSIGGQPRNRMAALSRTDGVVTSFNPNADESVDTLAMSTDASIIYAGGRFSTIGGQARIALAALHVADGSATSTFDAGITGSSGNGVVFTLAVSGSTLYVGGSFSGLGGEPRTSIGAVSLGGADDGMAVAGFDPSPSYSGCPACAQIFTIAVAGSNVYVGGLYDSIGGEARLAFAQLRDADGTATPFNPTPNNTVFKLVIEGPTLFVSGGFSSIDGSPSIGGVARNFVAAFDLASGAVTAFDPNPNDSVLAIGVSDAAVYLGGYFSSLGGVVRRGVAALDATDGTPTSFDAGIGDVSEAPVINSLAVSDSTLYLGGYFASIGGQPRAGLAALDAITGTPTSWNPGADGNVATLQVGGSTVYAGGNFQHIAGAARANIGAVDATTGVATTWNPNANSDVDVLALAGPLVYVGGNFTSIGGADRNKIAALDAFNGTATRWDPDPPQVGNVLAIAVTDLTVYAGGNFTSMHGQPRLNIAGMNTSDGTPTAFDPQANDAMSGGGVSSLAVYGSMVYAGGVFSSIGGQARNLLAELNASDGSATAFNPNGTPGANANAMAIGADGTLYVGGAFVSFDVAYQEGFAAFSPAGGGDLVFEDGFEIP